MTCHYVGEISTPFPENQEGHEDVNKKHRMVGPKINKYSNNSLLDEAVFL